MKEEFRSRVYTDRPDYADFDAPAKFNAIQSIIAKRLREHPNAICSYSGGADSDILLDLIERTRNIFNLPPIKYVFFNTGLEMKATKDHVKNTMEKYNVEIEECRPKTNIVQATRKYGVPFVSKIMSAGLLDKVFGENFCRKVFRENYELNPDFVPDEIALAELVDSLVPIMEKAYGERIKRTQNKYNAGKRGKHTKTKDELIQEFKESRHE